MPKLIRDIRVGDLVYLKDEFVDYTPDSAGGPIEIIEVDIAYDDYSFIDYGVRGKLLYKKYQEWRVLECQFGNINIDKTNVLFRKDSFAESLRPPKLPLI